MPRPRSLSLLAALLALLPLLGCTKGDECSTCSSDADCKNGLLCRTFSDESKRCGSGLGTTQCRVR